MNSKGLTSLELFVLALTLCSVVKGHLIFVSTNGNCNAFCTTLDTALQNIVSNTTLHLEPGIHTIRSDFNVTNVADLSIVGERSNSSNIVIKCDDSLGLIFMDIRRLTIAGVVIRNCGFTGYPHVTALFDAIKQSIAVFFEPLVLFSAGIIVVDIEDFVMENSIVQENKGFGMVAINLIGDSRFSYVDFVSNHPSNSSTCNIFVPFDEGGSGGGLFLIYHDYWRNSISKNLLADNSTLTYEHSQVKNNYICRRDPFTVLYNRLITTLEPSFALNTSIAGSGGVSVSLGQENYRVSALFDNCTFINNSALYQNAAMNVFLYSITQGSNVIIQNCSFYKNGGLFYNNSERAFPYNGIDPFGALGIAFFVPIPEEYSNSRTDFFGFQPDSSNVVIQNCTFSKNRAFSAGGLLIFSFASTTQNVITVKDCIIQSNYGEFGSGLYITELSYSGFESRLTIVIDSIVIENNAPLSTLLVPTIVFDTRSAADFSNVQVNLVGNNTFLQNMMTAMYTQNSVLKMSGIVLFSQNAGINGGGLHIEGESYVVFVNKTDLTFIENSAVVVGGGLFVDFRSLRSNVYDCWLFFENFNTYCDIANSCGLPNNSIVRFIRNDAPFGRAVYGSNLFDCPWSTNDTIELLVLNLTSAENYPDISNQSPNELLFVYDPPLSDDDNYSVNTFPLILATKSDNTTDSEVLLTINVEIEPGQLFEIPLTAYDRLTQPVPLTIFSVINNTSATATIGISNRRLLPGGEQEFVDIPIHVYGSVGGRYEVFISTNEASLVAVFTVHVTLTECSPGFVYNNETMSCECEIDVLDNVNCNPDRSISFGSNKWIGRDANGRYIQANCIRDFCDVLNTEVFLVEPDTQCRNNRAGILCGNCTDGYSRVLGGTECEECTNNASLALIILFAALGIILFFILALFNITITDGFINGFIFYSNIFSVYTSIFLPVTEVRGRPALVFVSFLHLNFGIKTCFFNGMTELDLVGLTLIFPMYLLLILLSVALFGKYVTHEKMSIFYSKIHITHVFATLLYIFYSTSMERCIAILGYLPVAIEGEETLYRWGRDPNVHYGEGLHGGLVAVSVLLLIVLFPLPIILLVPKISYRIPFIRKYKPVIDAFIAPFANNRAFWISFRLIFRVLIYVIAVFGVSTPQLVLMSFCITSMTLLQAYLKPFASTSRNVVDLLFMLNLTLFSIFVAVYFDKNFNQEHESLTFMLVFMYLFSIMLLIIVVHYVLKRFECTSMPYKKAQKWFDRKLQAISDWFDNPHCRCLKKSISGKETTDNVSHTNIQLKRTSISYLTRLRESLLIDTLKNSAK